MAASVMPLGLVRAGRDATVRGLGEGGAFRRRLINLGLASGARIKVVKNDLNGPIIVSLGECRLAIGRGMALRIMVEE